MVDIGKEILHALDTQHDDRFDDMEAAEIVAVADQIVSLREQIDRMTARKDELTAILRERLKEQDEAYIFGEHRITVKQTYTFSEERARLIIPAETLPLVEETRTVLVEAKVKDYLAPVAYRACRVPRGKATVTVR